ncbi:hypothetical protein K8I28_13315 [bacterium]|nr:hypothetical protein [bacterium]
MRISHIFLGLTLFLLAFFASPSTGKAELRVGDIHAFWDGPFAVIQPEIFEPFTPETRKTLHSGMPVGIQIELKLVRTGFVKEKEVRVKVQYNIWNEKFIVITEHTSVPFNSYGEVLNYFENDFRILIAFDEFPKRGEWLIRMRAGERRVFDDEDKSKPIESIEQDLRGIARWLFKRGATEDSYCDWSDYIKLLPEEKEETR